MEIKEMSLEEKYDKLYDSYALTDVLAWGFVKEMGLTDKYLDYQMKVFKKMMPILMGSAFKLIKMLAPGRAFKMFVNGLVKDGQATEPLSNTEIVSLSDREAVIKYKDSVQLKKYRDIIKKSGLELDMQEIWELYNESGKEMAKDFGFEMEGHIEKGTITAIMKLKK